MPHYFADQNCLQKSLGCASSIDCWLIDLVNFSLQNWLPVRRTAGLYLIQLRLFRSIRTPLCNLPRRIHFIQRPLHVLRESWRPRQPRRQMVRLQRRWRQRSPELRHRRIRGLHAVLRKIRPGKAREAHRTPRISHRPVRLISRSCRRRTSLAPLPAAFSPHIRNVWPYLWPQRAVNQSGMVFRVEMEQCGAASHGRKIFSVHIDFSCRERWRGWGSAVCRCSRSPLTSSWICLMGYRLAGISIVWSAPCVLGRLICGRMWKKRRWPVKRRIDWFINWSIDWSIYLIDWLINWLTA